MSTILNDYNTKTKVDWSSKRNDNDRLRHRPHVVNTSNSRLGNNVRYYSSVDADIYMGDTFIDEVVSITWQVQQNALPLFGYNSYTFDDIALGNRIVSGQFVINYTQANYLGEVLKIMKGISRKMYGEDLPATSAFSTQDRQRRNLPIWDKGFDIMIGYGESNKSSYEQVATLDCCTITGCAQQLDYNGEPVTEVYSFIARDIKYGPTTTIEENEEEVKPDIDLTALSFGDCVIDLTKSPKTLVIPYMSNKCDISSINISIDRTDSAEWIMYKQAGITEEFIRCQVTDIESKGIIEECTKNKTTRIEGVISYISTNSDKESVQKTDKIAFKVIS